MSTGIVVGAAGGIGAACARVLDDCADSIVLAGRRREPLEAVAAELGRAAIVASGDVATAEGRAAILAAVKEPLAWVVLALASHCEKPLLRSKKTKSQLLSPRIWSDPRCSYEAC